MNEGEPSLMASEMAVWADTAPSAEGRKTSSRPVDLVHLSRYTLGERALEREVLELFCTQSAIYLERLRAAQVRQGLEGRRALAQRLGLGDRRLAYRRSSRSSAEALSGEALIAGARAPPPRHRVVAARGRDLYRRAAQGSLSARTPDQVPRRRWSLTFNWPIEHGPRAGRPFSRLHLSGASHRRCPVPEIGTTEARQCHGQDHLYPERRDGARGRGGARHDGDGGRGEEFDPRHRRRMRRGLRLRHLPCLCR